MLLSHGCYVMETSNSSAKPGLRTIRLKKGEPNFTALDFKIYLIGDERLSPPSTGLLNSLGPKGERPISDCDASAITDRTAATYLHRLGADYAVLRRGTFSDRNEDFAGDRVERFLPDEARIFAAGPNFFEDATGKQKGGRTLRT